MALSSPGGRSRSVPASNQEKFLFPLYRRRQRTTCTADGRCTAAADCPNAHTSELEDPATPVVLSRALGELRLVDCTETRYPTSRAACANARVSMTTAHSSLAHAVMTLRQCFSNYNRYRKAAGSPARTARDWCSAGVNIVPRVTKKRAGGVRQTFRPAGASACRKKHEREEPSESRLLGKVYTLDWTPRYSCGLSGSYFLFVLICLVVYVTSTLFCQTIRGQGFPRALWHSCPVSVLLGLPGRGCSEECHAAQTSTSSARRCHSPSCCPNHSLSPCQPDVRVSAWFFSYGSYTFLGADAAVVKKSLPLMEDRSDDLDPLHVGGPDDLRLSGSEGEQTALETGTASGVLPGQRGEPVASLVGSSRLRLSDSAPKRELDARRFRVASMPLYQIRRLSSLESQEERVSERNQEASSVLTSANETGRRNVVPARPFFSNMDADASEAWKPEVASQVTPSVRNGGALPTAGSLAPARQPVSEVQAVDTKEQPEKEDPGLAKAPEPGTAHDSPARAAASGAGEGPDRTVASPLPTLQRSLSRFTVTKGATAFRAVIPGEFRRRSEAWDSAFAVSRSTGSERGDAQVAGEGEPGRETAQTLGATAPDEEKARATTPGQFRQGKEVPPELGTPSTERKTSSPLPLRTLRGFVELQGVEERLFEAFAGEGAGSRPSSTMQNTGEEVSRDSDPSNLSVPPFDTAGELLVSPKHGVDVELGQGVSSPREVHGEQLRQTGERLRLEKTAAKSVLRDEEYSSELLETPFPPVVPRSQPHIPLLPAEKDPRDSPLYLFLSKARRPDRPRYRQRQAEFQDMWRPLTFNQVADHDSTPERHSPASGTRTGQGSVLWNVGFPGDPVPQASRADHPFSRESWNATTESTFNSVTDIRQSRLGWKQAYVRPGLGAAFAEASDPVANDWDPEKSPKRLGGAPLVDFSPEELARMKTEPMEAPTHPLGRDWVTPSPSVWRPSMLKQRLEDSPSEDGRDNPWDFDVTRRLRRAGESSTGGADADVREGDELLFDDLMQVPTPVPHVAADLGPFPNQNSKEGF